MYENPSFFAKWKMSAPWSAVPVTLWLRERDIARLPAAFHQDPQLARSREEDVLMEYLLSG